MKFISKALLMAGLLAASLGGFLLPIYLFDSMWLAFFVGGAFLLGTLAVYGQRVDYQHDSER